VSSFIINALFGIVLFVSSGQFIQFLINNKDLFEIGTHIATILGIPTGVYVYYVSKKRKENLENLKYMIN
jgi:Na+-driven multidrug efflux pump